MTILTTNTGWELIERSTCGLHQRPVLSLHVLVVSWLLCSFMTCVSCFYLPCTSCGWVPTSHPCFFYLQGFSSRVGWVLNPSSKLGWSSAQFSLKEPARINQGDTWGQYLTNRVSFWREPVGREPVSTENLHSMNFE